MTRKQALKEARDQAAKNNTHIAIVNGPVYVGEFEEGDYVYCPDEAVAKLYQHGTHEITVAPNRDTIYFEENPDGTRGISHLITSAGDRIENPVTIVRRHAHLLQNH